MKPFRVHSTKYDGGDHYRYPASVVREEANLLMLYKQPGTPINGYRGSFLAKYHTLEFYWSDQFYNLSVIWYANWQPRMHYINVATPASWADGTLRYIDLDLDVVWFANGRVVLDDEDEFLLHQQKYGYPEDLIAQSWRSSRDVRELIAQRTPPFDGNAYSWRPHGSA
jgi:hypothetical protein